jgi:hypothetical protein
MAAADSGLDMLLDEENVALRAERSACGELCTEGVMTDGSPSSMLMISGVDEERALLGVRVPAAGVDRGTGRFPKEAVRTGGVGGSLFRTLIAGDGGSDFTTVLGAIAANCSRVASALLPSGPAEGL